MSSKENRENPLDKIQSNAPDFLFNDINKEKADAELDKLFGKQARRYIRNVVANFIFWMGYLLIFCLMTTVAVRCWHLLMPENWCWLPAQKIDKIDNIIIGALFGLSARFFPAEKQSRQ